MDTFSERLGRFRDCAGDIIPGILRGIEKESLRITPDGHLSQMDHPASLGSALTHPSITTDYSEALIELVTPTFTTLNGTLDHLNELHRIVYYNCPDELLWVNSLPCLLADESTIRIAHFGSSNIGKMKHVYRRGLELRYGKKMQTIAGIHYNISMPGSFWTIFGADQAPSKKDFISNAYMAAIRNFHQLSWLLFYLFGASPAACNSFFNGEQNPALVNLGTHTQYGRYATSLRMSNIGYRNPVQSEICINHNSIEDYTRTLRHTTDTPYPAYSRFGVKQNGRYVQLNTNLLQIENEYYSVIRPKRTTRPFEKPTNALEERGVEYLEVRCLDLEPNVAIGISEPQARFVELFILLCLLESSPPITDRQPAVIAANKDDTVLHGRQPGLKLHRDGAQITLKDWGLELVDKIAEIAAVFDTELDTNAYQQTVEEQQQKLFNAELTVAAQITAELIDRSEPFFEFEMRKAEQAKAALTPQSLEPSIIEKYQKLATESIARQRAMEDREVVDFDQFLKDYFAQ